MFHLQLPMALWIHCACLFIIIRVTKTAAVEDRGYHFDKTGEHALTSLSPTTSTTVSRPLDCGQHCASDSLCLAYTVSGANCKLYADNGFTSELVSESGSTVFQVRISDSVVGSLITLNSHNKGATNGWPSLAVQKSGTVVKWKVSPCFVF